MLSLMVGVSLSAQTDSAHTYSVNVNAHVGVLLPEYGFINYLSKDFAKGFEVNVRKQSFGKTYWDQLYRYPGWGISFFFSTMGSAQSFGNQFSIYPYYMLNIVERKKWRLSYQMGIGVSYATKEFNLQNNYENLAIGSHLNIHYHADVLMNVKLNSKMAWNVGIAFNHISNANLSEPNVGLNFATLNTGLSIGFGKMQGRKKLDVPAFQPSLHWSVILNGGMKHTRTFESFRYPAFSLALEVTKRSRYKFAYGAGADFFYDSSVEPQMVRLGETFKSSYAYQSGIHLSQEFIYDKVSLILQEGVYLGLTDKLNHRPIYNRVNVRWQFLPHISANLSLKSYLYILDFPELGVGFTW